MAERSKAQETADRYIARMKIARDEAKKAFDKEHVRDRPDWQ